MEINTWNNMGELTFHAEKTVADCSSKQKYMF